MEHYLTLQMVCVLFPTVNLVKLTTIVPLFRGNPIFAVRMSHNRREENCHDTMPSSSYHFDLRKILTKKSKQH